MKLDGRQVALCSMILVWAMSCAVGLAAEEQAGPAPFVYVIEEDIIPERMETYMQARIAQAKLSAQYEFEFPYVTFVQDFHVTTVGIFKSFAQLDNLPQKMEAWNEKAGGKAERLDKQSMPCVSRVSTSINVERFDLSYIPKDGTFPPDFSKPLYQSVVVYHIKPGKYEEAEAVAKKIKQWHEKRQSPLAYVIEERIIGQDASAFIGVAFAKNKAAFAEMDEKMKAQSDAEWEKLMAEGAGVLTKIEAKEATLVPEASYLPPNFFGGENGGS